MVALRRMEVGRKRGVKMRLACEHASCADVGIFDVRRWLRASLLKLMTLRELSP